MKYLNIVAAVKLKLTKVWPPGIWLRLQQLRQDKGPSEMFLDKIMEKEI
jgi:hypothetical protein